MANKHAKAKNPRIRAVISLVAIVVVVAVCAYLGLFGFGKGTMINYLKPWGDAISLGLDCAAAFTPCTRQRTTAIRILTPRWNPR